MLRRNQEPFKRLPWKDFPEFVREVEKYNDLRQKRKDAVRELNDLSVGFVQYGFTQREASIRERAIRARADELAGTTTAGAAMASTDEIPTRTREELTTEVAALEIAAAHQMNVIRKAHVAVRQAIAKHNLDRFRKTVARNLAAIREIWAAMYELRSTRSEIAYDMGCDQDFSDPGLIVGGIAEPTAMCAPLGFNSYLREHVFAHEVEVQLNNFTESAERYLENSK